MIARKCEKGRESWGVEGTEMKYGKREGRI
jgi:hypothetical protein